MTTEVTVMVESVEIPDRKSPRRGFSFVEILFAVMILGIGFIMIAGIFPVAISQTQSNGDETIAATTARQAAAIIGSMPNTSALMVSDGTVHRFGPGTPVASITGVGTTGDPDQALWRELNGSQVLSEDPRYAWVPFYCRRNDAYGLPGDWAQITIFGVRVRNHAAYVPSMAAGGDLALSGTGPTATATLIGTPVTVKISTSSTALNGADQITFVTGGAQVAPGTFVILAGYPAANNPPNVPPAAVDPTGTPAGSSAVGWVLKVGTPTGTANVYYLQPGGDIKNSTASTYRPSTGTVFSAFIVGQGSDPDNPPPAGLPPTVFTGGAQDVMAYTTFIPLH
jgi:hypothetical protein